MRTEGPNTARPAVYRTSTAQHLVERLGLADGMRAAAQLLMSADVVIIDAPDEAAELVARELKKTIRAA